MLFKRVLSTIMLFIIMLYSIPWNILALESTIGNSYYDVTPYKDKDLGKAYARDIASIADSKYEKSTSIDVKKGFDGKDSKYAAKLSKITESTSIEDLENLLLKSKLVYKPKNEIHLSSSYKDNKLDKDCLVVLSTGNNSIDNRSPTALKNMLNELEIPFNDVLASTPYISILMDTNKDSYNYKGTPKFLLRYYFYAVPEGAIADIIQGWIGTYGHYYYYCEYDITPVIEKIMQDDFVVDPSSDSCTYELVGYLRDYSDKYAQEVIEDRQEDQVKVFKEYESFKTSFANKSFIVSLNKYLSDGSSSEVKEPDNISSDKSDIALSSYIYALKSSNLMKKIEDIPEFSFIKSGTIDGSSFGDYDLLSIVQAANETADKYARSSTSYYYDKGIESNAGMFYDIISYRLGKVVLPNPDDEAGVGSVAADKRTPSVLLDKFLVTMEDLKEQVIDPKVFDAASNMKMPSCNFSYEELLGVYASLQFLDMYSKDESVSGIKLSEDSDKYCNTDLDKSISERTEENPTPILDSSQLKRARAYVQIKQGLDYLGIAPWNTQLEVIVDYASKFSDYDFSNNLDEYISEDDKQPLKRFFSIAPDELSSNYLTGVALSSTYIPMQTNLYDPTSIRVLRDDSWLSDFHVKYGFYRKALMIDVNVNSAVDLYITKSKDSTRVATLRDLLEHEKDIVLYVDDNFYNTDEIAEATDKVYERLVNTEEATKGQESLEGWFDGLFNNGIEDILKTGPVSKYDPSTIKDAQAYGESTSGWFNFDSLREKMFTNGILLSGGDGAGVSAEEGNDIKKYLDSADYTSMQAYAVVSAIYRDKSLVGKLNAIANNPEPVFISSPKLSAMNNVKQYYFNSIYNYYMLKNLESCIGVDYKTTLDLDLPIYIDIYGNIVTESGLVVIPAASNATLYKGDLYSPYTLGFMALYSNGNRIEGTKNQNLESMLADFTYLEDDNVWVQKNYEFDGVPVNPASPSVSDENLLNVLYDNQINILNENGLNFEQHLWLCTEVLRGAPIENIDKAKEGLAGKRDVSKYGLYMSWKLDEISDALLPTTNGNSIISMPNLAFIDGIEYVILFIYKAMLIAFVAYIMYRIYIDAVGGRLGLHTFMSCISTIVIFVICLSAIPKVISMSYNEPNKLFLQDEVKYINLLNYEKSLEGREISAVGVDEPKTQTELFLKLDSVDIPWYNVLKDVMFSSIDTTISELYEEELMDNMLYGYDDVQVVNDGVYISVDDLFESSSIMYNSSYNFLYQNMNSSPTASYFIPYYYFIDMILGNIGTYNRDNNLINLTTKVQSDGSVCTMGMIGDYLLSEYFLLDAVDPLGLYDLYGIDVNEQSLFSSEELDDSESIKRSMWYVKDDYTDKEISSMIDELYSSMRSYVAQNREMIGRVTDDAFIKSMMLDMSIEYNNIFKIPAARGIEVFNVDSRDLIRLSVTDKNTAVVNSTLSFGRFIYEQSGGLGVILTAMLLGVYFISSIVKPAFVIFLCVLLVYNLIIKSMLRMEKTKTVEGLLYVLAIMIILNGFYAIVLKLSMSLPSFGVNSVISIIGQICIQVLYLFVVAKVVYAIFKDMSNFGFNIFNTAVLGLAGAATGAMAGIRNKFGYTEEQVEYMESAREANESSSGDESSSELRKEMERRDKKRDEAKEDEAFMEEVFGNKNKINKE